MTCIVWYNDTLYADSYVYKGRELLQSLTKIKGYITPFPIKSDEKGFEIDDTIYGWTGTGGYPAMSKFADWLENQGRDDAGNISPIVSFYALLHGQALITSPGNLFEIFLVGKQFNHTFRLDVDDGFSYRRYEKDETILMGSGHDICMNIMANQGEEGRDVLRAMLETFLIDQGSGGAIDIWSMEAKEDKEPVFRRSGFMPEVEKQYIRIFLDNLHPDRTVKIEPAFINRAALTRAAGKALKIIQGLESQVEKQRATIARYEKRLSITRTKAASQPAVKPAAKKAARKKPAQAVNQSTTETGPA